MSDWTDYFLQQAPPKPPEEPRVVVALSIFDAPESVQPKPPKPKEAPTAPKKEPEKAEPASIFQTPPAPAPEKAKEPEKPKAKPKKPKAKPKKSPKDNKWQEFLDLFYESGKKKVQNPNPKTKKKYPEVMFSTAMKDKAFKVQVAKEYQAWLQGGQEEAKEDKPKDVPEPKPGDKVVDRSQLKPGVVVTNHGKPGYNKTWKIGKTLPNGKVLYHKLKSNGTWTKKTYELHPAWIDNFMAGKHYEFIEDPAEDKPEPQKKPKKPAKAKIGDSITSVDQLENGMIVENKHGHKAEVSGLGEDGSIKLQAIDEKGNYKVAEPVPFSAVWAETALDKLGFKRIEHPKKKAPEPEKKEPEINPFQLILEQAKKKEEEAAAKAKVKEKTKAEGKKISTPDQVSVGDAVMWEHDGKKHMGHVQDTGDGAFYVQSIDENGKKGPYFILDASDLKELGVHYMDSDAIPAAQKQKIPPKPDTPEIPEGPKKPEAKKISSPSEAKVGDHVEWELKGKTYRGEITSFESDGRFRAKIYWPTSSQSHGKSPSFDAKKIADRNTRIIDPEATKKYQAEIQEHEAKAAQMEADYSAALKKWQKEKDAITGDAVEAEHPTKRKKFESLSAAPHWNPNSSVGRKADRLLSEISKEHGKKIKSMVDQVLQAGKSAYPSGFDGAQSEWDAFSDGEKALYALATSHSLSELVGGYFTSDILTYKERQAWQRVLSSGGWQSNSGNQNAHELMGALEELGLKGGPKKWEGSTAEAGRSAGRKNKELKNAIAKALAYAQLVYDGLGVKDVTVYRGTSNDGAVAADTGKKVTMPNARELTSFSIRPSTAYGFNQRQIKYRVPARNLFLSPVTLASLGPPPPHGEAEYIVADLADLKGVVLPQSQSDIDHVSHKLKVAAKDEVLVIRENRDDLDWIQKLKDSKKMEENKKTAHRILRLAKVNDKFKDEFLGAMRRIRAPRDFAIDQQSQQVLLTGLRAGDVLKFSYEPKENEPAVEEKRVVLFSYDPANRGVELATKGTGRDMLEDRGPDIGVVYVPSKGKAYPIIRIKHFRSAV
jgi:hypothetical protein